MSLTQVTRHSPHSGDSQDTTTSASTPAAPANTSTQRQKTTPIPTTQSTLGAQAVASTKPFTSRTFAPSHQVWALFSPPPRTASLPSPHTCPPTAPHHTPPPPDTRQTSTPTTKMEVATWSSPTPAKAAASCCRLLPTLTLNAREVNSWLCRGVRG